MIYLQKKKKKKPSRTFDSFYFKGKNEVSYVRCTESDSQTIYKLKTFLVSSKATVLMT